MILQLFFNAKLGKTDAFHYQYLERSNSISKSLTERGFDILKAVKNVEIAFENSEYSHKKTELKNFQILEGVYTFLAYLAFVKEDEVYNVFGIEKFIKERKISTFGNLGISKI
ncbi:MAG: hypothetical protein U0T85_01175 [Cloacibacterium normanense]